MKINSVLLRISGGIGNQLFQFSYALAQTKKSGGTLQLTVLSHYQNHFFYTGRIYSAKRELRFFELFELKYDINISNKKENFILDKLLKLRFFRNKILRSIYSSFSGQLIFDGYFQSEEEFSLSKTVLVDLQHLYRKKNERHNIQSDRCVIHVRAGDLLKQPWNQLCGQSYYHAAINYMKKNFNVNNFDVVTEDGTYASKILSEMSGVSINFLPPGDEISDFTTIADYPYIICANSTFSWWAAVLGCPRFFCSPEYFYRRGDKPDKFENEHIILY